MAPVFGLFAFDVDFDVVDALFLVPGGTSDLRVEFDVRIQIILRGKVLKVLLQISARFPVYLSCA